MRIPEPLFVVVNLLVRALLCSPLHPLLSNSVMLIRFRGRKTNKLYATPVRYIRDGNHIRCFTSKHTRWWRSIRDKPHVILRIAGQEHAYHARTVVDAPNEIRPHLLRILALHPSDAPYHNLTLDSAGKPVPDEVERELRSTVMIVAAQEEPAAQRP